MEELCPVCIQMGVKEVLLFGNPGMGQKPTKVNSCTKGHTFEKDQLIYGYPLDEEIAARFLL